MNLKLHLLVIATLFAINSFSQEVKISEARQAALNFFKTKVLSKNNIAIANEQTIKSGTRNVMYAFSFQDNNGFILISAEKNATPVLSYSYSGSFNINDSKMPAAYRDLLKRYKAEITELSNSNISNSDAKYMWQTLLSGASQKDIQAVGPLLDPIKWDQDRYYNALCPQDNAAGAQYDYKCPTGCVATAMSQVMRFWKYPATGVGQHSYNHATYGQQSANFATTTYDWDNMPPQLTSANNSVATVLYHAGVSVDMDYAPGGSGASSHDARNALVANFRYSPDAIYKSKDTVNDARWKSLIKGNLDKGWVVFYAGSDSVSGSGHAFICDGYDTPDHFHFNWGWGGAYNSYNYLTSVKPTATGTGGGNGDYTSNQRAIFDIHPASDSYPNVDFTSDKTIIPIGDTVTFTDLSTYPTGTTFKNRRWNFLGGSPDTSIMPTKKVVYTATGQYPVKLAVYNFQGGDSITRSNYITVVPPSEYKPIAKFQADYTTIFVGDSINFTDMSQNLPLFWKWTFSGGIPATSAVKNPANIKYSTVGKYDVKLVVRNTLGSDSLTKVMYVNVIDNEGTLPPEPEFSAAPRLVLTGQPVNFVDSTKNNPTSWSWTFTGGTPSSSVLQNPIGVTYTNPGFYPVTLTVSNTNGTRQLTKTDYIYVTGAPIDSYCDTITNVGTSELVKYYNVQTWGCVPGNNSKSKIFAEKFTNYTFTDLERILISVHKRKVMSTGAKVRFKVWSGTTLPTTELRSIEISPSSLISNWYNPINFTSPVPVNGTFFVGFELVGFGTSDTLIFNMANDRGTSGNNTLYCKQGSEWKTLKTVFNYSSSLDIIIMPCLTGISEKQLSNNYLLYPNPANENVTIQFQENINSNFKCAITDILGKEHAVEMYFAGENSVKLETSNLNPGVYFISFDIGSKKYCEKITVIR